jgi:tellurite resistance protein TerC
MSSVVTLNLEDAQNVGLQPAAADLNVPAWAWAVFGGVVLASLAIDLVSHRGAERETRARAVAWSAAWLAIGLLFGLWVALQFGRDAGEDYVTAYLVEKSLSVDNLFVFLIVFQRLRITRPDQHRVLFWGILGALVTRGAFIAGGLALLHRWHGVVYVLGAFLVVTGIRTATAHEDNAGEGRIMSLARRYLPLTQRMEPGRFTLVENGVRLATPLLLALIVIEATDVMFSVDSIPAVFAVSDEPFIVYSSNVFAVLGLRALYIVLAGLLSDLKYLRFGLAAILVFAGTKMLIGSMIQVPHAISLLVILGCLVASIVPSVVARRRAAGRDERAG